MTRITFTSEELDAINDDRDYKENCKMLASMGGIQNLMKCLKTSLDRGIAGGDNEVEERRQSHGSNKMPEPEVVSFFSMFWESFEDTTVQILMVAAVISLAVGLYEDIQKGWIEGATILAAVVIVAVVTAVNNYEKEAQFRNLNRAKDNIDVSVVRSSSTHYISVDDVVVGDIVLLESGNKIPADGLVLSIKSASGLMCNESAITGETDDRAKSSAFSSAAAEGDEDPYLLSGTTIASGECAMVVIAVGARSRWGRTKAIEPKETPATPLQEKLDTLAGQIGNGGMVAAGATFIAMVTIWWLNEDMRTGSGSFYMQLFDLVLKAFIMAVTIVVVAVPEGLPLAVTVSLAYSTAKMMKDNNLIRVLSACETMGNATCICSDKTGTLTQNKMTVRECWVGDTAYSKDLPSESTLSSQLLDFLAMSLSVNSTVEIIKDKAGDEVVVGNRTEAALLFMLQNVYGRKYAALRSKGFEPGRDLMFSFTSARKCMSVLRFPNGPSKEGIFYCKGAAEIVLSRCDYYATGGMGRVEPKYEVLSKAKRAELEEYIASSARKTYRCVVVAHKTLTPGDVASVQLGDGKGYDLEKLERGLTVDAIYCISDPLRPDVPAAIKRCHDAGIVVRMITGDNVETARAIAKECGIFTNGEVMDGATFRQLTPKQLDEKLPRLQVLARSSPIDKYNLVCRLNGMNLPETQEEWEAMHPGRDWATEKDKLLPGYKGEWEDSRGKNGLNREVVGVTGDGTNDAPALRVADVGLSMGLCGTEAAKEASDIVILDDNFSSIVKAVLWGRSVYDNIRKFLQFQLTVNIVALVVTFGCAVTGLEPPLNAVMMLWVNLIMDTMGALALGTEAPSEELLDRAPYKRDASLISAVLWRNILIQSAFQLVLMAYLLVHGPADFGLVSGSVRHTTFIFNTFVFCQVFNEFNARSISNSPDILKDLGGNIIFMGIIFFTVVMQWGIVEFGGDFVKTVALDMREWYWSVLLASLTIPVGGFMRLFPAFESNDQFAPLSPLVSRTVRSPKSSAGLGFSVSMCAWVLVIAVIIVYVVIEFGDLWGPRLAAFLASVTA